MSRRASSRPERSPSPSVSCPTSHTGPRAAGTATGVGPAFGAPRQAPKPHRSRLTRGSRRSSDLLNRAPVRSRAAVAHLLAEPTEPILAPLAQRERDVLRTHLDELLFVEVLGSLVPRDLLRSASQRARVLAPFVPSGGVVMAPAALWVHTGIGEPSALRVAHPERRTGRHAAVTSRTRVPERDVVVLSGVRCTSLARAAVDMARTAPPAEAVRAVLLARAAGLGRHELGGALDDCLGADQTGRPRAVRILDAIVGSQAQGL